MDTTRYEPCRSCRRETKHKMLAVRRVPEPEDERAGVYRPYEAEYHIYELLECLGCESVCLKYIYGTEPTDLVDIHYYPPAISRRSPKWIWSIPPDMRSLFQEIYAALAADSPRLAVMGARALIDMVLTDKIGDVGSFERKLDLLEEQKLVSHLNREQLATALDAGSAAIHRGSQPTSNTVGQVLDIAENIIEAVYVLPTTAEAVSRDTPPRKPRAK